MKSRKKKSLPVRAKRYQKKRDQNLEYNNLEPRHLLAADFAPTINFIGSTDLITMTNPVSVTEGVNLLRAQLELGENESLKLDTVFTDQIGYEHFKYQQYFNNIPIEGSNYTLHVKDSQIVSISGDRVGLVNPVVGSQITSQTALENAMDHTGASEYAWQDKFHSELLGLNGTPEGELVYITGDNGGTILTYKFDMYAVDLGSRDYVYVNANTGVIEATESRIRHQDVDATGDSLYNGRVAFTADQVSATEYRLRQVTDGVETFDNQANPSNDFSNAIDVISSSPLFDAPIAFSGVSAHWGAENTLSMYQDLFGRDSYDNQSSVLTSYVNVNENWVNATWNGSVMQYGEGDGTDYGPIVEIDVVGHEITHGVTEFSANLVYRNEPGALNESFSDIFGELVENFATGTNDWLIGANEHLTGDGFRSFIDPNSENQPDTYFGNLWFTGGGDNGGVHFNSGVQNKWFYILSEGEAGTNDNGEDYDVTGIGIDDAAQIAYRNLTVYLGVNSQYQDARNGAVQAAIDIFGKRSPQHMATDAAWEAVGLYSEDIFITSVDEVVPGSMIFTTQTSGAIDPGESRNVIIELDAGQTLTIVVEGKGGVHPLLEIEDPTGMVIAAAGQNGARNSLDSIPITESGEYTIVVDSPIPGGFSIRVLLNATLESELIQSLDNGQQSSAQNIENSVLDLSAISADRLGVFGQFEVSEIPAFTGYDFESGVLDGSWSTRSTHGEGRIRVLNQFGAGEGGYALFMDTTASGFVNLNEAIWTVDLSATSSPFLNFYHASFNDENTELPGSFNGTIDGDGVSVSDDGITWHTILTDSVTDFGDWHQMSINLGDLEKTVGLELNSTFQIKFQQYDDDLLGADGRAYDGISITATSQSEDWYSFDLTAGEVATVAAGQSFARGSVMVELYDSGGNLLETGLPTEGVASQVSQFVANATDTYFARLVGSTTGYGLVVTRGTDLDTGSSAITPQNITVPSSVIGFVDTLASSTADPDLAEDKAVLNNFFEGVTLSNNITGGSVYAVRSSFPAPTGINVFGPSPTNASGWQAGINEIRADFDIPQTFVSIVVGAEESVKDVGFIRAFDVNNREIDEVVSRALQPGETQTIWVTSESRQIAYIVAGGFGNDVTPLDSLKFEVQKDSSDFYSYDLQPNQLITVSATFPGTDPFLFENSLVNGGEVQLRLELINPGGQVVATGTDNLSYYSAGGGTHVVRVSAVAGKGNYQLKFDGETQSGRINIGDLGLGVAVNDLARGRGYLMYSAQSVSTRFASTPPAAGNADKVIAVRYNGFKQNWAYNDDNGWHEFSPVDSDRLIALVNFDTDRINSLDGLSGQVHGISQGFADSDLQFNANIWNSTSDVGEFEVTGTYFVLADDVVDVGPANYGIASDDAFMGMGFMMYSEEAVQTRFAASPPPANAAPHLVTVRFNSGGSVWEYHNDTSWNAFTPEASDLLVAEVNFSSDTVQLLTGKSGEVNGIERGIAKSDLAFIPNQWNGNSDPGEFGFTGSSITRNQPTTPIGVVGFGVGAHDSATGTGFMMYSEENVFDRFAAVPPRANGAEQMVAVRFNSSTSVWQYSDNLGWVDFAPVDGDRLIAAIDYDADTIVAIEGYGGQINGIHQGFLDSDLVFLANAWDGTADPGEFQVTGTHFSTAGYSFQVGTLGPGVAVDDAATGTGYLLYSDSNLFDRFSSNPPLLGTATNMIAVRFAGGNWEYNDDVNWNVFTPTVNDRLIAAIDFDLDTITSLVGVSGNLDGIDVGYFDTDLRFAAGSFDGSKDTGEFQVFGTSFIA